ncbi:hypothetical protein [Halorubrum sp. C191]|uniref:hypothetical protein n=1 Tax=Halorubrum sp. C191 TaxID=1383842 RepID=UPI0011817F5F|nr:hypothetical protein [Halorubrum sp. C191]
MTMKLTGVGSLAARTLRALGCDNLAKRLTGYSSHDALVARTARKLVSADTNGRLYVDHHHCTPAGAANTRGADVGTWQQHVPDVVYTRFDSHSLVIEVERESSLDTHAASQLADFVSPSYQPVLVVPRPDHRERARNFLKRHNLATSVTLAHPYTITEQL